MLIRLPFPDPALFPNRANGKHWTATRALKDKARADAYLLAKNAAGVDLARIRGICDERGFYRMRLTFMTPDRRRRDLDGMLGACKHAIDGIAAAIGVDDSMFRPVVLDWDVSPFKSAGSVLVEIGA